MSGLLTTPPEALGPTRRESVFVEGRTFLIERPTDTPATLEPVGGAAGRYLPYWVDLWPAARMLEDGGTCLLTDQDRPPSAGLRLRLAEAGLAFTAQLLRAGEPGGRRAKGTLYRITRAGQ